MDKVDGAIARLQEASKMSLTLYKKPLLLTYSGGKDSTVCLALCERAGVPFEVLHNLTTADAPDTVYFVRDEFKRLEGNGVHCEVRLPTLRGEYTSMWQLIRLKMIPPTRTMRYCCDVLKERGGQVDS